MYGLKHLNKVKHFRLVPVTRKAIPGTFTEYTIGGSTPYIVRSFSLM